jgi:hypothetical protein
MGGSAATGAGSTIGGGGGSGAIGAGTGAGSGIGAGTGDHMVVHRAHFTARPAARRSAGTS